MAGIEKDKDSLAPLTFKVPGWMYKRINDIVENEEYESRADLIRDAIQKLIDWELKIPSVNQSINT